ncbi:MAG: glycoside hydrolase family 3 C-terminal domain-containing protein [Clostridia bacterium]|nr:glycoside hydrolase family 3 C-terminal domain-containing protein [Clostridia bacterium]
MSKKIASELYKVYKNPNGPVISNVSRNIIEKDGLYFKDIDGSGEVSKVNDWRLPAKERAEAYAKLMSTNEKIGQIFTSQWRMGIYADKPNPRMARNLENFEPKRDETGLLDETELRTRNIFGEQFLPGTTTVVKDWFARHMILRESPQPNELADWLNQMHALAEECEHFVPISVMSNSRNENGEVVFGMNDATGVFATWPGTMGIAAAVKGDSIKVADEWADAIKRSWNATGLKKGYMYMADVMTDPRWQRTYGTFGEDPELVTEIFEHIVPRIQGSDNGVTADGVAMTVKHFPGGGARENGFDPHYAMGQWNVYQTEGSLKKYHLPAFQAAVNKKTSSIMPYYAKPAAEKSAKQEDLNGNPIDMSPRGFAYNKYFIDDMLRTQMGFDGYINSDTGIVHNMSWGVEALDIPERIGYAVNNAGVDLISGMYDLDGGKEAYARSTNGYYDEHPVPEGYNKEELVLTDEALDRAVARTLRELFELGMFEDPYRDPKAAVEAVATASDWENAAAAHRKSVVLLKNKGALPLSYDCGKKIYAEAFTKAPEAAQKATAALREMLSGNTLVDDPKDADIAILMLNPSSGAYFSATAGYLELDICEDKVVCNVDNDGRPTEETHTETTLSGANRIPTIADAVHANGGKVIVNINVPLAWQVGNVEPYADALTVGFDTFPNATLDVFFGRFNPVGKLPITLPKNDAVLKVDENGVCISPNDVPGFDKDKYMPDSMKDENGKAYAYRDSEGNYYELNFGLNY